MESFEKSVCLLRASDSVAVAKRRLASGTVIQLPHGEVRTRVDIPPGHKLAVRSVADGAPVLKYGQTIGFARGAIAPGEHVHTHNVDARAFGRSMEFCPESKALAPAEGPERTFLGYRRANGKEIGRAHV